MAKDGYEDIKRRQSNCQVNHSQVTVLAGGDSNLMEPESKIFAQGLCSQLHQPHKMDSERLLHCDMDLDIEYNPDRPDLVNA